MPKLILAAAALLLDRPRPARDEAARSAMHARTRSREAVRRLRASNAHEAPGPACPRVDDAALARPAYGDLREKRGLREKASWVPPHSTPAIVEPRREEARSRAFRGAAEDPTGVDLPGGARRLGWEYPGGVNVLAEHWLETDSPRVVAVMEADSMAPFGAIRMHWGDLFGIEAFPAMTGEQGMEMLRQAMPQQG
jgi:hypothetical protein